MSSLILRSHSTLVCRTMSSVSSYNSPSAPPLFPFIVAVGNHPWSLEQFFYFSNYSTTMEMSKKERIRMNIHLHRFRQRGVIQTSGSAWASRNKGLNKLRESTKRTKKARWWSRSAAARLRQGKAGVHCCTNSSYFFPKVVRCECSHLKLKLKLLFYPQD